MSAGIQKTESSETYLPLPESRSHFPIEIFGLDSIPGFRFISKNPLKLSTYFIQEMLKRGYLSNTTISMTSAYNLKIIKKYLKNFEEIFKIIGKKGKLKLDGPIKHDTFRRLTG